MAELTISDHFILDMLGPDLKAGILAARERTGDDTIMARIDTAEHVVERGGQVVHEGLSNEECLAALDALTAD